MKIYLLGIFLLCFNIAECQNIKKLYEYLMAGQTNRYRIEYAKIIKSDAISYYVSPRYMVDFAHASNEVLIGEKEQNNPYYELTYNRARLALKGEELKLVEKLRNYVDKNGSNNL